MDGITIAILCIAASNFVIDYIVAATDGDHRFPLGWAAVVTLLLWKHVFALSIIVIILAGIGLLIDIIRHAD
jgi:hypothetical protein